MSKDPFNAFNSGELSVVSAPSRNPILLGARATFAITLTNLTAEPLSNVTLTNVFAFGIPTTGSGVGWNGPGPAFEGILAADPNVASVTTSQGTYTISKEAVVCSLGGLGPNGSATVAIEVEPRTPDLLHHLAFAVGTRSGSQRIYGSSVASTEVTGTLRLSVNPVLPKEIEVTWPLTGQSMTLQTSDSPLRGGVWTDVTEPVSITQGRNSVRLPIRPGIQFFHLVLSP